MIKTNTTLMMRDMNFWSDICWHFGFNIKYSRNVSRIWNFSQFSFFVFSIDIWYQHVILDVSDDDLIFKNYFFIFATSTDDSTFCWFFMGMEKGKLLSVYTWWETIERRQEKAIWGWKKRQCIIVVYSVGLQWHSKVVQIAAFTYFLLFDAVSLWYMFCGLIHEQWIFCCCIYPMCRVNAWKRKRIKKSDMENFHSCIIISSSLFA